VELGWAKPPWQGFPIWCDVNNDVIVNFFQTRIVKSILCLHKQTYLAYYQCVALCRLPAYAYIKPIKTEFLANIIQQICIYLTGYQSVPQQYL
jgi:hypothetical protein